MCKIGTYQQESLSIDDPNGFSRSTTSHKGNFTKSQQILNAEMAKVSKETLSFIEERKGFWEAHAKGNI